MIYNRPEYWLKKKSLPILAASSSWYSDDALPRSDISKVTFSDNYIPTGSEAYIWDASAAKDGSVMAYITGTELTLVGNGSGCIYANPDSSYAFCEWYSLGNIDNIAMLNTSLVTNMQFMFAHCGVLTSLDVSGFDTSNVTNMRDLFYLCDSLSALDVSQWETSQVADMQFMFAHCSGLTSLDVSGWNTSACTDMSFMFFNCSALTSLNISSFNTTSVQTPSGLSDFATWCDALTSITLGENFAQTYNVPEANGSLNRKGSGSLFYVDPHVNTTITGANAVMEAYEWQVDRRSSVGMMKSDCNWYLASVARSTITKITMQTNYTVTGNETESWDASSHQDGSVMAYRTGTEIVLTPTQTSKIYANRDSQRMFSDLSGTADYFSSLTEIAGMDILETRGIKYADYMFRGCTALASVDVSGFDTRHMVDMRSMFNSCRSLSVVDVSRWDTRNVDDMAYMFFDCSALTSLNISSFNTTSVQTPSGLSDFATWCDALTSIALGENFAQTYNVPEANGSLNRKGSGSLFYVDAYVDTEITGANAVMEAYEWQVDRRSSVGVMQNDCNWYLASVTRSTITKITMQTNYTATGNETESWDASRNKDGSIMAYRTGTEIVLTPTQTSKIYANRDSQRMFSDLSGTADYFSSLTEIAGMDILETRGIKYADYMFRGCTALASVDVSGFDTRHMVDMRSMFNDCTSLSVVDVSRWDTQNVNDMAYMFYNCAADYLDVSSWNTAKVKNMSYLFRGYTGTILDVSNWDTSACTDMNHMFYSCPNVTVLDVSGWNTAKVTDMSYLFRSCESVGLLDLSGWNTSLVTNTAYMFRYCRAMTKLDMNGFDNSAITSSASMFRNCNTGLVIYVSTDAMKTWVTSTSYFTSGVTVTVGAMPAA